MFNQYLHFKAHLSSFPELKGIFRCSGLRNLDEILTQYRSVDFPCLVVEEAPDLRLNLSDRDYSKQQLSLYVLCETDRSEDSKTEAYIRALEIGKKLFSRFPPTSAILDKSDLFAFRVGPLPHSSYGYGFNYTVDEE